MKITKKQIKKIILEELSLVMRESTGGGVSLWNYEESEPGGEDVLPLQYGTDLIISYSLKMSEMLQEYFKDLDEETKELILRKMPGKDDVEQLYDGSEQSLSSVQMLMSLDPKFVGYPICELRVGNGYGDTGVKLEFDGKIFEVLGLEKLKKEIEKNDGDLEVGLGFGMPSASTIGGIIANEISGTGEDADVEDEASGYVTAFDPGVADGESGMDYETTAHIRILKLIEDINNGNLRVKIIQEYEGDPDYIYCEVVA